MEDPKLFRQLIALWYPGHTEYSYDIDFRHIYGEYDNNIN